MANLKIPMEGKIEIELSEEAENVMQRFISAVELLQGTTIDVARPNVRMVGIDAFGRPQFEKRRETKMALYRVPIKWEQRGYLLVHAESQSQAAEAALKKWTFTRWTASQSPEALSLHFLPKMRVNTFRE